MSDRRTLMLKILAITPFSLTILAFVAVIALGAGSGAADTPVGLLVGVLLFLVNWLGLVLISGTFWGAAGTVTTLLGILASVYLAHKQRVEAAIRDLNPSQPLKEVEASGTVGRKPGDSGPSPVSVGQPSASELLDQALAQTNSDEAIRLMQQATKLAPLYVTAWSNLTAALFNAKRYQEALEAAKRLYKLSPNQAPYLTVYAKILRALGRRKEALKLAQDASEMPTASANTWHTLGLLYGDMRQDLAASKALEKAVSLALGNAEAKRDLGDVLVRLKRYDAAIKAYDSYLSGPRGASDFRVMVKKARVLLALKEYGEALKAIADALKVNPTFGHALQAQADILKAQGKTIEARKVRREGKKLEHARTSVASVKLR